jgi:hypothetical protein
MVAKPSAVQFESHLQLSYCNLFLNYFAFVDFSDFSIKKCSHLSLVVF